MITTIRKMGNSQGILIPKPFLAQTGMDVGQVELQIEDGAIVIRKVSNSLRQGWAEASQQIAAVNDAALVWPEFANEGDKGMAW